MSSASEYPLPFRIRPDLEIRPLEYQRRQCWVVRDPVALKHYFVNDEEHAVLRMLDGHTSAEQLQQQHASRFAPRRLGSAQLQSFLVHLQRHGLLVSLLPNAAATQRRRIARQQSVWRRPAQWLSLRIPLLNPDPLLKRMAPLARGLFSRPVAIAVLLGLAAMLIVALASGALAQGSAEVQRLFAGEQLYLLGAALLLVRVVHELGHGLACRLAGRPCTELGVTLLFGIPVLYCDVSSAWTIGGKWRRMAISAAGIYVELIVATLCLALWWFSKPGVLHSLCLHVVLVCSAGTLLLNGNPLMRYDGYYLLADWLEIPNLDQVGRSALKRRLWSFFLGVARGREHLVDSRRERFGVAYAVAASVYRTAVLLSLIAFLYYLCEPYRLEALAVGFGLVLVMAMVAGRLIATARELRDRQMARQLRWKQFILRGSGLLLIGSALLALPLPHRVRAPALFEPQVVRHLYVTAGGRIVRAAVAGSSVAAGDVVVQLENPELARMQLELAMERDRLDRRLKALEARRSVDPDAAAEIPATRQARDDFQQRFLRAQADAERLTLRAPHGGVVLRPPARESAPPEVEELASWSGTPLDPENRGAWLEPGTLVATVVPPGPLVAVAIVEQSQLEAVALHQSAFVRAVAAPRAARHGQVIEIARRPVEHVPPELAAPGDVPLSDRGENRPLVPSYQVRIALDAPTTELVPGSRARCRIVASPRSCAQHIYYFLRRTFSPS